jgi:hypothetical protein
MNLKTICLAGATLLSLAIPAVASADPWDHDGWRWREREHYREWQAHEAWEHGRPWGWYGPRCVVEDRGFYDGWGRYHPRPARICYR